jgi:hypothetical protein
MKWFIKAFRQYADFSDRASRQEFWMFVLFNLLFAMAWAFVAGLLTGLLGGSFNQESRLMFMYKLIAIYYAVTTVPAMAVGVRRLHDTGRSGWWMLVSLIPFVGGIWLIVLMCLDGSAGDNRYGSPPDGTTGNVPKYDLRQKALMWLTAFAVFSIYMCLLNLVDVFSNRWYTGTDQLNMLLTLLGNFLVSVSFIIMGIAFLQKRDYSRTVGGWIIAAYVIRLILDIWRVTQMPGISLKMAFVPHIMLLLVYLLYGRLLLAKNRRLTRANYVLMAASGCEIIVYHVSIFLSHGFMSPGFFVNQPTLIVPLSLLVYATANCVVAEKKFEYNDKHP